MFSANDNAITSTDLGGGKTGLDVNVGGIDLSHTNDSVRLGDGTNLTVVTANGELKVKDSDLLTEVESVDSRLTTLENAISGNRLAVNVTDGTDSLAINSDGSINANVVDYPNSAVLSTASTVTTSSAVLLASQLTNRRIIYVQNLSNKDIFIGGSAVSVANGLRVARGATVDFPFGDQISLYAIGDTGILGTGNVRVLEIA